MKLYGRDRGTSDKWLVDFLLSPLVGNPSDFFKILKKDSGQAGMTAIINIYKSKEDV
jgi:hypothetical protein